MPSPTSAPFCDCDPDYASVIITGQAGDDWTAKCLNCETEKTISNEDKLKLLREREAKPASLSPRLNPPALRPRIPPEGLVERRAWEQEKYSRLYRDFPEYGGRGNLRRLTRFVEWAKKRGIGSLLDVGCGKGEFLFAASRQPVRISKVGGYEFVEEICTLHAGRPLGTDFSVKYFDGLHDIPEPSNSWDWVMCCDVLEHVQAEDGIAGLAEMVRVAREGLYLTISWAEDAWGRVLGPGEVLHINRQSEEWWLDVINDLAIADYTILRTDEMSMDVEVIL